MTASSSGESGANSTPVRGTSSRAQSWIFVLLAILVIAYGTGEHWPRSVTPQQWGWFLWLAIPASTGAFGLWFAALAKGGAMRTSGFLFLSPSFTVILSYFILGATCPGCRSPAAS
jgi:drug/metabolite transporter (DMT)-like permease